MNLLEFLKGLFRFNRTNWRALFLCFAAASVFWIFNALNQEQSATVKFPLTIIYDKAQFVPTARLPENIEANVSGSGWDILLKSSGFRLEPIKIIPENLPGKNNFLLPSATGQILPLLDELRLNYFPKDTLTFSFDRIKEKKFPIRPDISEVSFRPGFILSANPFMDPSEVLVTGPSELLDALPDTLDVKPVASNLDEDWENRVLVLNVDGLKSEPERVKVIVKVEQAITIRVSLPVTYKKTKSVRPAKDSLFVVMQVPVSKAESIPQMGWNVLAVIPSETSATHAETILLGIPIWAKILKTDTLYLRKK